MGRQRFAPQQPSPNSRRITHRFRNSNVLEGPALAWLQWPYDTSGKAQVEIARTHLAQIWNQPHEYRHPKKLTRKLAAGNEGYRIVPELNMAFMRDTKSRTETRPIDMRMFPQTINRHRILPSSSNPRSSRHMRQDRGYITSATDLDQFDRLPKDPKLVELEHSCSTEPKVKYIDPRELTRFPSIGHLSGVYTFAADCHGE
jgi:hypothetical protein